MKQVYDKIGFTISSTLLTLFIGFILIQFGGVIDVADGVGFDGVIYEEQVKNFEQLIAEKRINADKLVPGVPAKPDRFMPAMLVHYGMKFMGIPFETAQIVRAYQYHNLIWLILGALAWAGIAHKFQLQDKNKWFGWVMFFCTWATLKMPFFDPVLTDTMALCLSFILLFFFFQKEFIAIPAILICGIVGAFVWKPILIYAYILLLFPHSAKFIEKPTNWVNACVKFIPASAFAIGFFSIYLFQGGSKYFEDLSNGAGGAYPFMTDWIFLSAILGALVTFFYFYYLFINSSPKNLFYLFTPSPEEKIDPVKSIIQVTKRILPVVILFFAVKYFHTEITPEGTIEQSTGQISAIASGSMKNPLNFFKGFFYNSYVVHAPLEFLVAHAVYFGVWWVMATVFFKEVAQQIREKAGVGVILIFVASLAGFLFNPQSRIGTSFMPFVFVFVITMIDKNNWHPKYLLILGAINIVASKVWLPVGKMFEPVIQNGQLVGHQKGEGWDNFFMQIGMQMPPKWYGVYLVIFLLIAGWLIYERKTLLNINKKIMPTTNKTSASPKKK